MKNIDTLKEFLSTPKKIVITTHTKPDADALGSSLAIYQFLSQQHHNVEVIVATDYPEFLKWMPFENNVTIYTEQKKRM
jgi:phosphoesterase RecJ-like protein